MGLVKAEKNMETDYIDVARALSLRRNPIDECVLFALHSLEGSGREIPDALQKAWKAKKPPKPKAKAKSKTEGSNAKAKAKGKGTSAKPQDDEDTDED